MTELVKMMASEEAGLADRMIKNHLLDTRALLLEMRDRKGWQALGYESFEAYGEDSLGFKKSQLYRLATAAEIEQQLLNSPMGEFIDESIPER